MSDTFQATSWLGLARHFFWTVAGTRRGRVLLAIWTSFLAWSLSLRRKVKQVAANAESADAGKPRSSPKEDASLAQLLRIAQPHVFRWPGALLGAYVMTLITRIFITVKLADLSGHLAGKMGLRQWSAMFLGQVEFAFVCMAASLVTGMMKFLEKQCALSLRSILFEHLVQHWLESKGVLLTRQDIADAPARLSSDLTDFAQDATHLLGHFLKPLIDVAHLTIVLSTRIGARNLAIFYGFFVVADRILKNVRERALPVSLKSLSIRTQELESELRERLFRLQSFREQVAMQGGTDTERKAIVEAFNALVKQQSEANVNYFALDVISSYLVKYGGLMTAFSILTPSAYLDPFKAADRIVGDFLGNSSLLGALASALKDLGDSFSHVPRVRGLAQRVHELESRLDLVDEITRARPRRVKEFQGDCIEVRHLTTAIPGPLDHPEAPQQTLTKNISFVVRHGDSMSVAGENGTGKTSLFRTLAGLWDPIEGEALIPKGAFFVPQDSYFTKDTLARQICYPLTLSGDFGAGALLAKVGLSDLVGKLNEVKDWSQVLSGGQKQRIGFARLLCHFEQMPAGTPRFAFLDEPVSAVSKDAVVELIRLAQKSGVTLVTISHSDVIDAEHPKGIVLKRSGEYELVERDGLGVQ